MEARCDEKSTSKQPIVNAALCSALHIFSITAVLDAVSRLQDGTGRLDVSDSMDSGPMELCPELQGGLDGGCVFQPVLYEFIEN